MNRMHLLPRIMGFALLAMAANVGRADLMVDFNDNDAVASPPGGAPPSPNQTGFTSVTTSGAVGVVTDIGTIDISVNAGADDRDRGPITGGDAAISNLARDIIFTATNQNPSQAALDIVLSGILAGQYDFTGFFHDATANQGTMDVSVSTDGGANFTLQLDDLATSTGAAPVAVATGNFSFNSNGIDDIVVRIATNADGQFAPTGVSFINGFQITAVPEPASIALWTLLGIGAVLWGVRLRRRRR